MDTDIFDAPPAAPVTMRVAPNPELTRAFESLEAHPVAPFARPAPAGAIEAVSNDPMYLVQLAVQQNFDVDKLQRIIDMRMAWQREEARKAFTRALVAFKRAAPTITKDKHVSFTTTKGTTEYDHATLSHVCKLLNEALGNFGLCASWEPKTVGPSRVAVTCLLEHEGGHSRAVTLEADFDTSGGKNVIQGQGSAISYLERYTLLAACGLSTEGQDDDGRATAAANAEKIVGENILDKLLAQLRTTTTDEAAAAVWKIGRDSIDATKNTQAADEFRAAVVEHRKALKQRRAA